MPTQWHTEREIDSDHLRCSRCPPLSTHEGFNAQLTPTRKIYKCPARRSCKEVKTNFCATQEDGPDTDQETVPELSCAFNAPLHSSPASAGGGRGGRWESSKSAEAISVCAVKIGVHGVLRFTALPVHTSHHFTLTLQQRDTSSLDRSRRDTKMRYDSLSL